MKIGWKVVKDEERSRMQWEQYRHGIVRKRGGKNMRNQNIESKGVIDVR